MLARWEVELDSAAKEYEEKYGEPGKVWLSANSHAYMNIWHAAERRNTTVDDIIKEHGYIRVKAHERDRDIKQKEIKDALIALSDEDKYVCISSTSNLYKKIYNLARSEKCTIDDIIERCGYLRVRCSMLNKEEGNGKQNNCVSK